MVPGSYRPRRLGAEALGRGARGAEAPKAERAEVDLCSGRPWAPQL